jgi:hypothetical protein
MFFRNVGLLSTDCTMLYDNDKPIKSLLKGLLTVVGLARLDSQGELLPMSMLYTRR